MLSRLPTLLFVAVALASVTAAQTTDAFGLSNSPRGAAALSYDPAARHLTVSNIGSSGQDGVSIALGESYGFDTGWESIASAPDGAGIEMQVRLNGLPPGTRYIGNRAIHTGTTWTITGTALGLGASGFSYLVLDHGQLTGRFPVSNGGAAVASAAPIGGMGGPTYKPNPDVGSAGTGCDPWETLQWTCDSAGVPVCGVSFGASPSAALSACCSGAGGNLVPTCVIQSFGGFRFGASTTFTISGTTCAGDMLLLVADVPGDAHSIATVDVIARNLGPVGGTGSLTLNYQKIEFEYKPCANLGNSLIHVETGPIGERRLPVNNIGSSGQDGVSIDLGRSSTWNVLLDVDPAGTAPVGAALDCQALGIRNGVDDQPIGSVQYRRRPAFFDVFADFSDIGSLTHQIVLLDQGTVVLDLPGHTGQVGTSSAWPAKLGKLGGGLECFVACSPAGTQFTINGAVYVADELRILADGATATVSAKTSTRLRGQSLSSFTLRGVTTVGTDLANGLPYGLPCPCGNSGAVGHGCGNSVNPAGALLEASGISKLSADSLVISGSGMPSSSALYFQGSTQVNGGMGVVFGDGKRCVGPGLVRLGTKLNALGTSSYPGGGDLPISIKGQITAPGGFRYYQVWYRNAAAFCTAATFNLSNGMRVEWAL